MKILMGLHERSLDSLFGEIAQDNSHTVIRPDKTPELNYKSIIALLDDKPDRVLMDSNYGSPGSNNITPIIEVRKRMLELGYDVNNSLLGISGNDYAHQEAEKAGINSSLKPSLEKIFEFLA